MITEEAKKRATIIIFWKKYGTQATEEAYQESAYPRVHVVYLGGTRQVINPFELRNTISMLQYKDRRKAVFVK